MDFWNRLPALTGVEHHVETEKVETVADVGDVGIFVRQLHTAIAAKQLSDSLTQSLCVSLGTSRDELEIPVASLCRWHSYSMVSHQSSNHDFLERDPGAGKLSFAQARLLYAVAEINSFVTYVSRAS